MAFLKPAQLNKIYDEYEAGRNKVWNRDEEMRKIEETMNIEEREDGRYNVNLQDYREPVSYNVMDYIRKLIYRIRWFDYLKKQSEYEIDDYIDRIDDLKDICKDLYNRIPPELRPPPPF